MRLHVWRRSSKVSFPVAKPGGRAATARFGGALLRKYLVAQASVPVGRGFSLFMVLACRHERLLRNAAGSQLGNAMPTVLLMMSMGGLVIVPTLNYTTTMLRSSQAMERDRNGFYSADAGVEHGLHTMKNNPPSAYPHSYTIPTLNGLSTTVVIERLTTLYGIVIGESGEHAGDLAASGAMVYNEGLSAWVYTVTVTNKAPSVVHLNKLLVKPPVNFAYIQGTTTGQITTADPQVKGIPSIGITLVWSFSPPLPFMPQAPDPENGQYSYKTNTMRLNGPQGYSGSAGYVWVVANREDIGAAGADAYSITATAREGTAVAATVKAGVVRDEASGEVFVIYYEQN